MEANTYPDSKVHETNMGPTLVLTAPDGPHVGPMNLAIRVCIPHISKIGPMSKEHKKLDGHYAKRKQDRKYFRECITEECHSNAVNFLQNSSIDIE